MSTDAARVHMSKAARLLWAEVHPDDRREYMRVLGRLRWAGKSLEERRAHSAMMVARRRAKAAASLAEELREAKAT